MSPTCLARLGVTVTSAHKCYLRLFGFGVGFTLSVLFMPTVGSLWYEKLVQYVLVGGALAFVDVFAMAYGDRGSGGGFGGRHDPWDY